MKIRFDTTKSSEEISKLADNIGKELTQLDFEIQQELKCCEDRLNKHLLDEGNGFWYKSVRHFFKGKRFKVTALIELVDEEEYEEKARGEEQEKRADGTGEGPTTDPLHHEEKGSES